MPLEKVLPARPVLGPRSPREQGALLRPQLMIGRALTYFANPAFLLALSWTALALTLIMQTTRPCSERYPDHPQMKDKSYSSLENPFSILYTIFAHVFFVSMLPKSVVAPIGSRSQKIYMALVPIATAGFFASMKAFNPQPGEVAFPDRVELRGKVISQQSWTAPMSVMLASLFVFVISLRNLARS